MNQAQDELLTIFWYLRLVVSYHYLNEEFKILRMGSPHKSISKILMWWYNLMLG